MRSDDIEAAQSSKTRSRGRWALLGPLALGLSLVTVFLVFDLEAFRSPDAVASWVSSLRDSPYRLLYVLCAFAVGTLLFLPITALIVGTTLTFGPYFGFTYAMLGACLAACVTYWAGRLFGGAALTRLTAGERLGKLALALRTRAFRASLLARLLPVGNFTVINLLAGSMRIPFAAFMGGTLVGVIPGVLMLTLFAEHVTRLVAGEGAASAFLAGALLLALVASSWLARRYLRRRSP